MKLSDFYGEGKDIETLSNANIDDIIWQAKNAGVTQLIVKPTELNPIWQFLAAHIGTSDTKLRRLYFVEGKCPRILGVDIEIEYTS